MRVTLYDILKIQYIELEKAHERLLKECGKYED